MKYGNVCQSAGCATGARLRTCLGGDVVPGLYYRSLSGAVLFQFSR